MSNMAQGRSRNWSVTIKTTELDAFMIGVKCPTVKSTVVEIDGENVRAWVAFRMSLSKRTAVRRLMLHLSEVRVLELRYLKSYVTNLGSRGPCKVYGQVSPRYEAYLVKAKVETEAVEIEE